MTDVTRSMFVGVMIATMALLGVACGEMEGEDPLPAQNNPDAGIGNDSGGSGNSDKQGIPNPSNAELPDPADFKYSSEHTFEIGDILGGFDGVRAAEDSSIVCTSGCEDNTKAVEDVTLFPIDSGFGYDVIDYQGATLRARDGDHGEGWVGTIERDGESVGLAISTTPTVKFKAGPHKGQWCAGLGGEMTKCKSESYVAMEHVLTCDETIPYMFYDPATGMPTTSDYDTCQPLDDQFDKDPSSLTEYGYDLTNMATTSDYSVIVGETPGDYKFIWGNMDKRPISVRLVSRLDLPDDWKNDQQDYRVTKAKLAIVHTVANNPNDKIKPEDLDTEAASGRLPGYEVDDQGRWISTRDCYEGDGDFIPKGTVLKNPDFADSDAISEDVQDGFTNAWFTTLDRAPVPLTATVNVTYTAT